MKTLTQNLVEVVTVADVDDEDRAGNSLLQIWELRFGHNIYYTAAWRDLARTLGAWIDLSTTKRSRHDRRTFNKIIN